MSDDYLWDKSGEPDPEIVRLEELLSSRRLASWIAPRPPRRRWPRLAAVAGAAAAALVLVFLARRHEAPPPDAHGPAGLRYAVSGHPGLTSAGPGAYVDLTSRTEGARIRVGDLGEVDVAPGSRLRVIDCGEASHRLFLERGTVAARISARPREFQIDTPAGLTVDLGCAYEVRVDDDGVSHIRVQTGRVSFEAGRRKSYVPAGAACLARPGRGPSVPFWESTAPALREAIERLDDDRPPRPDDLARLRRVTEPRQSLPLWHLLAHARAEPVREAAWESLSRMCPPPERAARADVMAGSEEALEAWRTELSWQYW